MSFTDIFIRRPVLASVVNLMILALGRRAMSSLPVLQYPRTQNAVITLSTTYYGADPDVIAGFIRERHRPGQRHRLHELQEFDRCLDDHDQPPPQL
jgi:AcrB/AcrD/AcrF family